MRITALRRSEKDPRRIDVIVDGEVRAAVAEEVVIRSRLAVDREVEPAELDELVRQDLRWTVREAALVLLAHRARTRAELARRLERRGHPPDVVHAVVEELAERGIVDDDAFAAAFVRDRLRGRPRGARTLVAELRRRGVTAELAGRVVERVLDEDAIGEPELARAAAEGWRRRHAAAHAPLAEPDRRRLRAYLARRGFPPAVIRHVLAAADGDGLDPGRESAGED